MKNCQKHFIGPAILAGVMFTGCSAYDAEPEIRPPNGGTVFSKTISAEGIETNGAEVNKVRAYMTGLPGSMMFAETEFENCGFSITLNSNFSINLMASARKYFGEHLNISIPGAKYSGIEFRAYNDSAYVGIFSMRKEGNPFFYSFSGEPLSISGSWSHSEFTCNYELEKEVGFGYHEKRTTGENSVLFTSDTTEHGIEWKLNVPGTIVVEIWQ